MALTILYNGSFNPPHRGHIAVADAVLERYPGAALWLMVSPQNPLKGPDELASESDRLAMTRLAAAAAAHADRIEVCTLEFELPRPSLTVDTLAELARRFPERRFALLIGSDNAAHFDRWVRYREILDRYAVLVYPRTGYPPAASALAGEFTWLNDLPLQTGEGTGIRCDIASGSDVGELLAPPVMEYIRTHALYGCAPANDSSAEPTTAAGFLSRGRRYQREGHLGEAFNDYVRALEIDPANTEAPEYLNLLREIFAFRDPDRYNP